MRVLLTAYACWPGRGSEPAIGWGWATALAAAGHDVTVLTLPDGADERAQDLARRPADGLRVEPVAPPAPLAPWAARDRQATAAAWTAYLGWMRAAGRRARRLHAARAFDVGHHVSYGSLIPGSPLDGLDLPVVFGPVGSGQRAPQAAAPLLPGSWRHERLRNAVVAATVSGLNPLAARGVRRSAVVLATNDDTAAAARALGARRVELMADTGVAAGPARPARRLPGTGRRRIAWIGGLAARKGLPLALDAVAAACDRVDAELHVAGDGPLAAALPGWIADRGLEHRVTHHGRLGWDAAQALLRTCDVLLFTSLRESLGSQVVEAAAAGVPIVALDLHGLAALVPDDVAVKVPLSGPDATAHRLADGLVAVLTDPDRHRRMRAAALRFAETESWPCRAARATRLYEQIAATP